MAQYLELVGALTIIAVSSFLLLTIAITYIRTGVPTLASARAAQIQVADFLRTQGVTRIYELGSGKGDFVFRLARLVPRAHVLGMELSYVPYLVSQVRRLWNPACERVNFRLVNFHRVDLRPADAVVFYLMPGPNAKLKPKLERELRPSTIVATVSFTMPGWKPEKTLIAPNFSKTRSYIYRMPASLGKIRI
jgi:trans-aconitate methyltransferase